MERLPVYQTRNAPHEGVEDGNTPEVLGQGQEGRTSYQLIKLAVPTFEGKTTEVIQLVISGNGAVRTRLIQEFTERYGEPTIQTHGGYIRKSIKKEVTIISWPI